MSDLADFSSSGLGTKKHWDTIYTKELKNFKNNGDIGDIWYGEESIQRVIDWIMETGFTGDKTTILDIGCGNGALLLALADEGYEHLVGIDYSAPAIRLAKAVAESKEVDITYEVVDLLAENGTKSTSSVTERKYSITQDKGTYDAISLCPVDAEAKRIKYIKEVYKLTSDDGYFVISSCNWVEDELVEHFKDYFLLDEVLPTPQFSFGGKVGSTVTCAIFKKKI